jgi:uncharacterized protein YqfB (UPF0267 family)
MTAIQVPDHIAPSIQRFVSALIDRGIDKLTFGQYANSELDYCAQELKSLAQRPHQDASEVVVTDRVRVLLQATGEAFLSPSGLEVSERVLEWMLNAFAKQEGTSLDEAQEILDSKPDGDRFWWFMQFLEDAPLNALAQILEKELVH